MKNKLRRAKQQLLWESYLKLKMIEDNHNELLKLLKVCQVIEKIKKMWTELLWVKFEYWTV